MQWKTGRAMWIRMRRYRFAAYLHTYWLCRWAWFGTQVCCALVLGFLVAPFLWLYCYSTQALPGGWRVMHDRIRNKQCLMRFDDLGKRMDPTPFD